MQLLSDRCGGACAALLMGGVLFGCKTVYVPNTVNVPLLQQRNEVRASITTHDAQVAYAATDHVGLMANAYAETSHPDQSKDSGAGGGGYLVEAGAGYFRRLPARLVFETYGGGGFGHVRHDNWLTDMNGVRQDYSFAADGVKLFLQPSLGFASDWLDAAVSVRLVGVQPLSTTSQNYPDDLLRQDQLVDLDKHTWAFVEPALTVRAGYKWVKAFAQWGHSFKLNDPAINRRESFLYFGLHLTFAGRFRRGG